MLNPLTHQKKKHQSFQSFWNKFGELSHPWWYFNGQEKLFNRYLWKDSDDKDEKHITKRISLIHSTKQTKEDLEIGNKEEQSVFTKEIYKGKKISFVAKFDSDATSKNFEK